MDTGKKRKRSLELTPQAQAQMEALPPDERTEVFRMLMAIMEDPSIGTLITPENCPHSQDIVDGKCEWCGSDVAQA